MYPDSAILLFPVLPQQLAAWFGIPEGEVLLADFHCALRKRVLLQVGLRY